MSAGNLLVLVRGIAGKDVSVAKQLGIRLMEHGYTVFLSDADEDLEIFGDVVDGYVEIAPRDGVPAAVLYGLGPKEQRAVLSLPADDQELFTFASQLTDNETRSAQ